ncbi:hypothetical protein QBC38DRAFT_490858 [Podospora fimiseda]|uniref:Uncharacterized protein n=1 Tax=Podospora fimiseda TaxID=252190 RepID=A0AAN6YP13_9PEZI|nr:hypothetical protein QBC38DRAFT_490858 [Podospora fimiseda]
MRCLTTHRFDWMGNVCNRTCVEDLKRTESFRLLSTRTRVIPRSETLFPSSPTIPTSKLFTFSNLKYHQILSPTFIMKLTTAVALLLPATTTLAGPIIGARQPAQRAKFIPGSLTVDGAGCDGATVSFDTNNEIATVSLPNFVVTVPSGTREKICNVALKVHYPLGCTSGTAQARVSGQDVLAVGVTGTYSRRYAVSPVVNGEVSEFSPAINFAGAEISTQVWSFDQDTITYVQRPNTPENQDITFRLLGDLQLQPSGSATGRLSNDVYVLDISDQRSCCK